MSSVVDGEEIDNTDEYWIECIKNAMPYQYKNPVVYVGYTSDQNELVVHPVLLITICCEACTATQVYKTLV